MKSPYGALLALRRTEEKAVEQALAAALVAADRAEAALDEARRGRAAWIDDALESGTLSAVSGLVARLEDVERDLSDTATEARRGVETAREALLERRRLREVVERLHRELLAEAARQAERRAQAELDDLGGLRARAAREARRPD